MTMYKFSAANERIKREYLLYQREAHGRSEQTIDQIAAAIAQFERFTRARDFKAFKPVNATEFKRYLLEEDSAVTGKPRSKSTVSAILKTLRNFFIWLAGRPGYRSRLSYHDADYFSLSAKDERIAHTAREPRVPELEGVERTIDAMPFATAVEKRDRALIAFTLITGARINALRTLRLSHVDWEREVVFQDAREVDTKNSKTITTPFYPISEKAKAIVGDWINYLKNELGRGDHDVLFPPVSVARGSRGFEASGFGYNSYQSDGPLRNVFKSAFAAVGLPDYNPHSFRKLIANIGASRNLNAAELKAWSMGLGHEHLGTMMQSYVVIGAAEQTRLMREIGEAPGKDDEEAAVAAFKELLKAKKGLAA
ncbi:MAG: tyrosine-type recombinase/integrase [Pseudomonadota bacterium]